MRKNKSRQRNKRKQKSVLKSTRRTKARRQRLAKQRHQNREVTEQQFSNEKMVFWICHGINYLVSNYNEGTWSPLFDGIYEGSNPAPESIARTILDKYGEDVGVWPMEGKAAIAWSVQDRTSLYTYHQAAKRHIREKHPDCDIETRVVEPHNVQVWELFNIIKQTITREHGS